MAGAARGQGTATELEHYLAEEAAAGERAAARARAVGFGMLVLGQLAAFVVTRAPGDAVGLALLAGAAVYAVGIDRAVAGRHSRVLAYATTAIDTAIITAVPVVISIASGATTGEMGAATKAPIVGVYFLFIALAGMRLSPALAIFAGCVSAAAFAGLLLPLLAIRPDLAIWDQVNDFGVPGVSVPRVTLIALSMVLTGLTVAAIARAARRAVERCLHTVTFLFVDIRDYTGYVERHGDTAAAALIRDYRELVRREIPLTGGRELSTEGDSFLVEFPTAKQALRCALAILEGAARRSTSDHPIRVGIGIHAGEPVRMAGTYIGSAVNVAARLCQAAMPGELLISDVIRGLLRTSDLPETEERSGLSLKGIADPPRVYRVLWERVQAA